MGYQEIQGSFFTMRFSFWNVASTASLWLVKSNVNEEKPATTI